jgi:hypothetical protein
MKNSKYFIRIILFFLTVTFWGISCKKDTTTPTETEKGKWLLSKVYYAEQRGTPTLMGYLSEEYIYNTGKSPWLDITYDQLHDTVRIDTLFYDAQNRLSQMGSVFFTNKTRVEYRIKTIQYNATDGKIDTIKVFNPGGIKPVRNIFNYQYNGSVIKQYIRSGGVNSPVIDSLGYTYAGDNLSQWYTFTDPGYGNIEEELYAYSEYDTCHSVLSYLNMNVYLPYISQFVYKREFVNEPILSKNNYVVKQVQSAESQIYEQDLHRTYVSEYTKDSIGLIIKRIDRSPTSDYVSRYDYQYIPAQ